MKITILSLLVAFTTIHTGITSHHGNPCHEIYENTTVTTPQGYVLCMVPSEDDLMDQLKSIGGYNKHYVATTPQEVNKNFKSLLPWDGAATTHPMWNRKKRLINAARYNNKRSYVAEMIGIRPKRSQNPSGIVASTKLGCISKGQTVGRKKLTQMCDVCQRSSELDIDRFPRFINELTCETLTGSPSDGGNTCSYGSFDLGKCIQSTSTIDLLKRTDKYTEVSPPSGIYFKAFKQIWVPYTQEIRSCCHCRY